MGWGKLFSFFYTRPQVDTKVAAAYVPAKLGKTCFVSPAGNNTTGDGSEGKPYATFTKAATVVDGSGWVVIAGPGTYTENPTFSAQNLTITAQGFERGGIVNISGTLTLSHTASSVRLAGISATTITHSGAGSLYLNNSTSSTALNSSGAGYLEVIDCDTQGGAGAGTISITGAGVKVVKGGTVGAVTVNNANAVVSVDGQIKAAAVTLTAGTLALGIGAIYAAAATGNALTATGGTLIMDGPSFLTPTGTSARISIAAAVVYDLISAKVDTANSTLSGTQANLYNIKSRIGGGKVTYQTSSNTKPASPSSGDWLFVTADGTSDTAAKEQWLYDGADWLLTQGSLPVGGSVLDNTLATSVGITTTGRYIVPASGLAGAFVGHANAYADFDGANWTFTTPANNDTVQITAGTNVGQVWKYTTAGGWIKQVSTSTSQVISIATAGGFTSSIPYAFNTTIILTGSSRHNVIVYDARKAVVGATITVINKSTYTGDIASSLRVFGDGSGLAFGFTYAGESTTVVLTSNTTAEGAWEEVSFKKLPARYGPVNGSTSISNPTPGMSYWTAINVLQNQIKKTSLSLTTAGATTTLAASMDTFIELTGSSTHAVKMFDATTVQVGASVTIKNSSTSKGESVFIDYGGASIGALFGGEAVTLSLTANATASGVWKITSEQRLRPLTGPLLSRYAAYPMWELHASTELATNLSWYVCGGDEGTWRTNAETANYWLRASFPRVKQTVKRVCWRGNDGNYPVAGKFQVSDDAVTWTDVGTFSDALGGGANDNVFAVATPKRATYFRLFFTSSNAGAVNPGLAYLLLLGGEG